MEKNGGPAFPLYAGWIAETQDRAKAGMSLRDYFAAKVLNGYAASGKSVNDSKNLSECAYEWADAMLKAREGK